jgi:hypothetical protein
MPVRHHGRARCPQRAAAITVVSLYHRNQCLRQLFRRRRLVAQEVHHIVLQCRHALDWQRVFCGREEFHKRGDIIFGQVAPAGALTYSFFFAYVLIALIGKYYTILSGETQQKICNNQKMRILCGTFLFSV